jgi:hypothetical protein
MPPTRHWAGGGQTAARAWRWPPPTPGTLPDKATWYLATNLPRPGGPRQAESPHPAASLAEIVRIYSIRHWTGQSYKQVKDQLGRADFQVRSDTAIRRHQTLVNCAFCFCWDAWFHDHPTPHQPETRPTQPGRGERGPARRRATTGTILATWTGGGRAAGGCGGSPSVARIIPCPPARSAS